MSQASTIERQMLDLINEERAAVGAGPVELELRLNDAAEDHSSWMLNVDRFSHTGIGNSDPGDRMRDADFNFSGSWTWGENIAWQSERGAPGLADDVENLHDSLMNSPGHRANILNPSFEVIGIGIERGDYNGWDAVMVTQNFARTGAPVQLDQPGTPVDPPAENTAPEVINDGITLARVQGERATRLDKHIELKDADGDEIVWIKIVDKQGRDNFRFKGEGPIDASKPFRVDADDLDQIRVFHDATPGDSVLRIRAFDGEDLSPWETITLTTLSADEWQAMG